MSVLLPHPWKRLKGEGIGCTFDDLAEDASCGGHICGVSGSNGFGRGGGSEVKESVGRAAESRGVMEARLKLGRFERDAETRDGRKG